MKKTYAHPLEDIFDIENDSTLSPVQTINSDLYDDDTLDVQKADSVIEDGFDRQYDEIYDAALEAFKNQSEMCDSIDPRFAARNAEVAAQYLKIALDTVSTKTAKHLTNKKIRGSKGQGTVNGDVVTNNNIIVADRNELLRLMKAENK